MRANATKKANVTKRANGTKRERATDSFYNSIDCSKQFSSFQLIDLRFCIIGTIQ